MKSGEGPAKITIAAGTHIVEGNGYPPCARPGIGRQPPFRACCAAPGARSRASATPGRHRSSRPRAVRFHRGAPSRGRIIVGPRAKTAAPAAPPDRRRARAKASSVLHCAHAGQRKLDQRPSSTSAYPGGQAHSATKGRKIARQAGRSSKTPTTAETPAAAIPRSSRAPAEASPVLSGISRRVRPP